MNWQKNYEKCVQSITVRSVSDILVSENPSLAALKVADPILPYDILVTLINDYLDFLSIGKTMSASQVLSTAKLILEDYSVLKPDDFVLFFNRCKKGQYGKVFDRMDGAQIFEWLEIYMYDREKEIEAIRQIEKKQIENGLKSIDETVGLPDYFKPFMQKKVIEQKPKPLNQTEQQKQINEWIKEFDDLWEMQGSLSGKRFVLVDGKRLDVSEWLIWKQSNE